MDNTSPVKKVSSPAGTSAETRPVSQPIAPATSGGPSESGISVPIVSPRRSSSISTATIATPAGNRRINSRSSSPPTTAARLLVLSTELVAVENRVELRIHRCFKGNVGGVARAEVVQSVAVPHHIGGDAGAWGDHPVHVAVALRAHPGVARRILVAAWDGVVLEEAVAEDAGRIVGKECVLSPPTAAVSRVVRVEVEQAAVSIGRRTEVGAAKAVDRLAQIRVAAE